MLQFVIENECLSTADKEVQKVIIVLIVVALVGCGVFVWVKDKLFRGDLTPGEGARYRPDDPVLEELEKAFVDRIRWPAMEWELKRYRVVFVYEQMDAGDLVEYFMDVFDEVVGEDDAAFDRGEKCAYELAEMYRRVEAFERITETLPESHRFQKLAVLTEPFETHVYLSPELKSDG
ncbi:MAG: hypothetical protein ACYTGQ_07760 [Planctomycetota bacterium]|jgi:hypothetical protein